MASASRQPRPSVLFIVSHDIAPRHGCYGGQAVTPHTDKLAREGIRFDNHFCQWPLCGPSRANLFTGCRPLTTRRYNNEPFFPGFRQRMGPDFASLPEAFRRSGYHTVGAGLVYHDVDDPPSWDMPLYRPPAMNATAARQTDLPRPLVVGDNKEWVTPAAYDLIRSRWRALQAQGHTESDLSDPTIARRAQGPPVEIAEGGDEVYSDGLITAHTAQLLKDAPRDRPFFIAAGFITGHTPFRAPRAYWDHYHRQSLVLPENQDPPDGSPEWVSGDSEPAQYYTIHGYERPWRASRDESRELFHGHLAAMSYIDEQVGRLVSALKETGRYDETIIVVVSDHGFHDGQHGYWGKHNLWDQSLRAPLIMRIPDRAEASGGGRPRSPSSATSRIVTGITEHVDIYPTLCELCGIPAPSFAEGASVVPAVHAPDSRTAAAYGKEAAFAHRSHMWHDRIKAYHFAHTVRTQRYRYTEYRDRNDAPFYRELFDYQDDPEERRNHIDDSARRSVIGELSDRLKEIVLSGIS